LELSRIVSGAIRFLPQVHEALPCLRFHFSSLTRLLFAKDQDKVLRYQHVGAEGIEVHAQSIEIYKPQQSG
jgi:hypothetical protein